MEDIGSSQNLFDSKVSVQDSRQKYSCICVHSWGANDYGQLGTGTTKDEHLPTLAHIPAYQAIESSLTKKENPRDETSSQIASCGNFYGSVRWLGGGGKHSVILLCDGSLAVAGDNQHGQLGIPCTSQEVDVTAVSSSSKQNEAGSTSCDNFQHTLKFSTIPRTSFGNHYVQAVACGWAHTIAIITPEGLSRAASASPSGQVFGWGDNRHGQLGFSCEEALQVDSPMRIRLPEASTVCSVAAGMRHSVVVSSSNNVYAWGSNKFGQLGLDTPSGIVLPTLIPSREDGVIVGCDAGANHTALLTNQGAVLCCGSNKFGQCSVADSARVIAQPRVADLRHCGDVGVRVSSVHCGWTHTAAVAWVEDPRGDLGEQFSGHAPNHVFVWGRNNYGQLGISSETPQGDPVNQDAQRATATTGTAACATSCTSSTTGSATYATGSGKRGAIARHSFAHEGGVRELRTGSEHILCLTDSGQTYAWGWNDHGMCATGDTISRHTPTRVLSPPTLGAATLVGCGAGFSFATYSPMT